MSIKFEVLGQPGLDNALLVQVDSGQSVDRLLFDCGDGCLSELTYAQIKQIDHLFFSHLHMDHIGGFDNFIRCNYCRGDRPNYLWGPPETARIIQHRLQGFQWNLNGQMSGAWLVSDVHEKEIRTNRFELREAFATAHDEGTRLDQKPLVQNERYILQNITLDHRVPSLGFVVRETPRQNVDRQKVAELGLQPGPWLNQVKQEGGDSEVLEIDGTTYEMTQLRQELITETPGGSIAYLTDFLLDDRAMNRLADFLQGCHTIVCESQYLHQDVELARLNYHLTSVQAAQLAKCCGAQDLVLMHISDRYSQEQWLQMLAEAQAVFAGARYPDKWELD